MLCKRCEGCELGIPLPHGAKQDCIDTHFVEESLALGLKGLSASFKGGATSILIHGTRSCY